MERRLVIKQVLIMAGGLALLPSCLRDKGHSSITLNNIDISLDQENLLAEIAETIIPRTNTPGAKELKLHLYALKMLDDCYEKVDQQKFMDDLAKLEDQTHDHFGKSFQKLSGSQRRSILTHVENAGSNFYQIFKNETINGYLNSKYVMTNLIIYELIPGRYNGYFPVKTITTHQKA